MPDGAKMGYAAGQTWDQAKEGAYDYVKALDQAGKLTDAATGHYNPEKAQTYFETLIKAQRMSGREVTGQAFRNYMSSAGTSKYAMDPDAVLVGVLQMEEQGSKAGVGQNEAIKQLTGARLDKAKLGRLQQLGLFKGVDRKLKKGESYSIEELLGRGAKNEEDLRANLLTSMINDIIPKMKEIKLDPTKSSDVAKFFGLTSSGKGTDYLSGLALRNQELARELAVAKLRPGGLKEADEDTATSSRVAGMAVKQQFQSVLGETGNALEGVTLPIMRTISSELSKRAEEIRKGTITPMGALEAAGMTGTAIAGLAATAGIRGMTSDNPAIAGLSGAAVALTASAGALTAAAGVQAMASGGKSLMELIGKLPFGVRGALKGSLGLMTAAELLSLSGDTPGGGLTEEPVERKRLVDLAHARSDLINKQNELNRLQERGTATPLGQPATRLGGLRPGDFEKESAGLKSDIDKLQAQIAQLQGDRPAMTATQAASITAQATADAKRDMMLLAQERDRLKALPEPKRKDDRKALQAKISEYQKWIDELRAKDKAETPYTPPLGWKPPTKADMDKANQPPDRPWTSQDIGPPPPNQQQSTIDSYVKAAELNDQSTGKLSASLASFGTSTSLFTQAFDSGASKLATAGQTAVGDMQAGASAIGAAIAAAFVAGASGIRIGVDAPASIPAVATKRPDTGSNNVTQSA